MKKYSNILFTIMLVLAVFCEWGGRSGASDQTYAEAYRREQERINLLSTSDRTQVKDLSGQLSHAADVDDYETAIGLAHSILRIDPDNYLAHIQLAFGYASQDRFSDAREQLDWVVRHFPSSPLIIFGEALLSARAGNIPMALDYLEQAYRAKLYMYLLLARPSAVWPEEITQEPDFQFFSQPNIDRVSMQFQDSSQFASYFATFPVSADTLFRAAKQALERNDDDVIFADKKARVAYSDLVRHGILGFPNYKRYLVMVTSDAPGSLATLNVKLFKYRPDRDEPVVQLKKPRLQPDKDPTSVKGSIEDFVKDVQKELRRSGLPLSKDDVPALNHNSLAAVQIKEEQVFARRQAAKEAKVAAAKAALRQQEQERARAARRSQRQLLLQDHAEEWVDAILDGRVMEGMPEAAIIAAIGEPTQKEVISQTEELWSYPSIKLLISGKRLSFVVK